MALHEDITVILDRHKTAISQRASNEIKRLRRMLNPLNPEAEKEESVEVEGIEIEPVKQTDNVVYWAGVNS